MLPSSHPAPILATAEGTPAATLADAFDAFMATAGRMEASYGQLQAEVAQLRAELEERNAALNTSLEDNINIRTALHRILQALPCGVIVIEDNETITLMNPEAERLVATPATPGLKLADLPAEIRGKLKPTIAHEDEHEFCLERERGALWISVRKSEMRVAKHGAASGSNTRSILILRDVTSRKKADLQREKSRDLVSLGEMAAVLAHEIRNPLSSLELWTGLLAKQSAADDETKYVIENLQAGVRSISATVNNVLQFHNSGAFNHVPLRLLSVLESSVAFVRPLADQAGIKLTLHAPLGKAEISGDANGLQQVILNLAINTFRHTARGGYFAIDARLAEQERRVVVAFADNGEGIPEADLPNIFEPRTNSKSNGPGLGLIICRRIVEQHRGTIRVESQRGKGTTFFLELPLL